MRIGTADQKIERLSADEPVAIISQATTKRQVVLETTLARAAPDALAREIPAPALIVVGEAVRLRAGLDWLSASMGRRKLEADPLGTAAGAPKKRVIRS